MNDEKKHDPRPWWQQFDDEPEPPKVDPARPPKPFNCNWRSSRRSRRSWTRADDERMFRQKRTG